MKFDPLIADLTEAATALQEDDSTPDLATILRPLAYLLAQSGRWQECYFVRSKLVEIATQRGEEDKLEALQRDVLSAACKAGDNVGALLAYSLLDQRYPLEETGARADFLLLGARIFLDNRNSEGAEEKARQALELAAGIPEKQMAAWHFIASLAASEERFDDAIEAATGELDAMAEIMGPDHTGLIGTIDRLIGLYKKADREDETTDLVARRRRLKVLLDG